MKKKFLIKIISIVLTMNLINGSLSFAKEMQKKLEEQEQKLSPQQENKQEQKLSPQQQKEKEIKTIEETLKKMNSLEIEMQQKVKQIFKDFKKEDYEVKNYNLEVFKKGDTYLLLYTHKKTGAKVYFNLILEKEKAINRNDELIFRAPSKDYKGLVHFLEHCIAKPFSNYLIKKYQINPTDINANTSCRAIDFVNKVGTFGLNENLEKEYVELLSKELNNPSFFKKGDKTFEIEKKRILNEIKDDFVKDHKADEGLCEDNSRNYDQGGKISEVEKATVEDLKNYYEKYIHPSNCFLIKNVLELNPKTIEKYLNMWHENYFKHYDKKEIKNAKYELKNNEKYLYNTFSKDSDLFIARDKKTNEIQEFKYNANLYIDEDRFNLKQQQGFKFDLNPFEEEIEKFIQSLGYGKVSGIGEKIILLGNNKEAFKKEVLEENYKKIMAFIANKLKNLNEKDLFYYLYYGLRNYNQFTINDLNLKNTVVNSNPEKYLKISLSSQTASSFLETGNPFSEKFFIIDKNNELGSTNEIADKYAKENINVYSELAKTGPDYIDVYERSDKTFEQKFQQQIDKYKPIKRVLPIKLKGKNNNEFVKDFAIELLAKVLDVELNDNKGLLYGPIIPFKKLEKDFINAFKLNKDSVKNLEDYFYKNFNKIMKNINIKEKDLNELKKQYKENFKNFKVNYDDYFKNENKMMEDFKNYIKTGKIDENSILYGQKELKILNFFSLVKNISRRIANDLDLHFLTMFKNHEDYKAYFERKMSFKEKYIEKVFEKPTPEFLKDFLENYLNPILKKVKEAYSLAEKKLKALDSINFKDVNDLIKTAYLVKDKNEVEKVNKNIEKEDKREENLKEKNKAVSI